MFKSNCLSLSLSSLMFLAPSLHTHARQGSNSESLPPRLVPNLGQLGTLVQGARFGSSRLPLPISLPLDFSVQQRPHGPDLYYGRNPSARQDGICLITFRFSSAAHLSRSRSSRRGNPALQSRDGQDNTESQTVQGASQPTRPSLSASDA